MQPVLSVVMLVIDNLELTRRAVESLRATTPVPHELIVVDNGSRDPATRQWLGGAADRLVRNEENVGVPRGWNQGLALASGPLVAIANNDIRFPAAWFERLSEHLLDPGVGLAAPASEGGARIQLPDPEGRVERLARFGPTPYGLLFLLRTEVLRAAGGFCEEYGLASNEDKDLCFTLWERGLDIVLDHRVVVPHVGGATWRPLLGACRARRLWKRNRGIFKRRWAHRLG